MGPRSTGTCPVGAPGEHPRYSDGSRTVRDLCRRARSLDRVCQQIVLPGALVGETARHGTRRRLVSRSPRRSGEVCLSIVHNQKRCDAIEALKSVAAASLQRRDARATSVPVHALWRRERCVWEGFAPSVSAIDPAVISKTGRHDVSRTARLVARVVGIVFRRGLGRTTTASLPRPAMWRLSGASSRQQSIWRKDGLSCCSRRGPLPMRRYARFLLMAGRAIHERLGAP